MDKKDYYEGIVYAKELIEAYIIGLQNEIGNTKDPRDVELQKLQGIINEEFGPYKEALKKMQMESGLGRKQGTNREYREIAEKKGNDEINTVYFLVENWKGLCEYNLVMTENDFKKEFELNDEECSEALKNGSYCPRNNITYDIFECKTAEELKDYLKGSRNTDIDEVVEENGYTYGDGGWYDNWYWENDYSRFGEEAIKIITGGKFVFGEDILVNDKEGTLEGYLWATDGLVDRAKKEMTRDLGDEDITYNFYTTYNPYKHDLKLECNVHSNDVKETVNETFEIKLDDLEKELVMKLFEDYCLDEMGIYAQNLVKDIELDKKLEMTDEKKTDNREMKIKERNREDGHSDR